MRRKKFLLILVLSLFLIGLNSPKTYASSVYNLQPTLQLKSHWCWNASSIAILHTFGINTTQYDFSTIVKGNDTNNDGATDSEANSGMRHFGISGVLYSGALSYSSIDYDISRYHPVYVNYQYKYVPGGHAVVIRDSYVANGVNYITYMDPWDATFYSMKLTTFSNNSDWYWYSGIRLIY